MDQNLSTEYSLNAILQHFDIEINEEPSGEFSQAQIGQQLALMNGDQFLNCLHFHNYSVFNKEIQ